MGNCITIPRNENTRPGSAIPTIGASNYHKQSRMSVHTAVPLQNIQNQMSVTSNVQLRLPPHQILTKHHSAVERHLQPIYPASHILSGLRECNMQGSEIIARTDPGSYVNKKVLDLQPNFDTAKNLYEHY